MNSQGWRPPSAAFAGVPGELVKVKTDGGDAGGPTSHCTATYAIFALTTLDVEITGGTATPLAEGLTPETARMAYAAYSLAPDASVGLAAQIDGEWRLLAAFGEVVGYGGGCSVEE